MSSSYRILRATRKITAGDEIGEDNFHEDFQVMYKGKLPLILGPIIFVESIRGLGTYGR